VQVIEFFQWVETLISLANFMPPCTSTKWCTLQYMGRKFAPEIWAETLNFRPRKFHHLTRKFRGPEIPPPGPEFLPLRLAYIKEGAGVKIPLGIFFHPRPSLSKPPPPPLQGLLRRLPSRRNPRISPVHAPLGVGGFLSSTRFSPCTTVLPQISLPKCSCPRSRFVWVDPFFIERSMFLR
jgi:hypothetical protein